jgi:AbrB family looped-hinge helix DNA binding protein
VPGWLEPQYFRRLLEFVLPSKKRACMPTVTVSDKGQVVIPVQIRRRLGIAPGCQLNFSLEGQVIHAEVKRQMTPTKVEDGFGMLVCKQPGTRKLADFDVATAMREATDDRA